MEQALYRKYRPKNFDEAVGQDHITKTLQKAIKAGRISHAYLFTGPRGVGKTSVARILAHEVNSLPYDSDVINLDIIEIDAASNRRIDEIRDLRDKVRIAPVATKYKVYIVDEVHMLTREAFNALLKTLEEPPAHCIFILATTEAHKLPETIISRTQRHEFKSVNHIQMASHLDSIAKKEKIKITKGALELLARFGEGSFRDSIGYLDQLSSYGREVTEADVREVLGLPDSQAVSELLAGVRADDIKAVSQSLIDIQSKGAGATELAAAISRQIRQDILDGKAEPADTILLKELLDVRSSNRPAETLEVILLGAAASSEQKIVTERRPERAQAGKVSPAAIHTSSTSDTPKPTPVSHESKSQFDLALWPQVIETAKDRAASIYTALRLAKPSYADDKLTLTFEFQLHQKKLDQAKNKALLADIIDDLCADKVKIECVFDKSASETPQESPSEDPIHSITNIFGTAEMMET
ncbi:DNA polymerase III subunit gamma/tau [Candidatus Saccharibacteria bacterium]|nr:DNA polymerase III subunit gamma/tau [Candidatus Saccharibacteria bacterium]